MATKEQVTRKLRSLELSGNKDKLHKFFEWCRKEMVDIQPWKERLEKLYQMFGVTFLPNHEWYQKYDNGNEFCLDEPRKDAKWSGEHPIPALGERVNVTMNKFGAGTIRAYYVQAGFLGVYVEIDCPPAWWVAQEWNKLTQCCQFFGAEIEPLKG